jgi:hypothetical protein
LARRTGVVDRVDADEVHRQPAVHHVLVGLDVAAAAVHVQLDIDLAVVLEREQVVPRADDPDRAHPLDVGGRDRARLRLADAEHHVLHVLREGERQRLEVADDLVHVLDHARDRLVLVDHAVDAERPHGRAAQRREQHAPHRVAERVAEAALERLEAKLRHVGVVLALRRFDELRADEPPKFDRLCHA